MFINPLIKFVYIHSNQWAFGYKLRMSNKQVQLLCRQIFLMIYIHTYICKHMIMVMNAYLTELMLV